MTPRVHPMLLNWLRSRETAAGAAMPQEARVWEQILDEAQRHCLSSLLYADASRGLIPHMPGPIRQTLHQRAAETAARNLLLASELSSVLRAADDRSISCAPLRGVALGEQWYGTMALRPTGDVDVLVPRPQLCAITELLRERGYAMVDMRPGVAQAFDYTLEGFKSVGGVTVIAEPHWSLAYPPLTQRFLMEAVWQRCRRGTVCGVDAPLLADEDLLVHLCLHWLHHRRSAPLLWAYELDRLVRRTPLEWSIILDAAQASGTGPLLQAALDDVRNLFGTPLPATVLEQLDPAGGAAHDRLVVSWLTEQREVEGPERVAVLLSLRGWKPKCRYVLSYLFPSVEFIRVQYGVASWRGIAKAYGVRFVRGLWLGVKGLLAWRRISGSSMPPHASAAPATMTGWPAPPARPAPETPRARGTRSLAASEVFRAGGPAGVPPIHR